jgi:hypothetical protein
MIFIDEKLKSRNWTASRIRGLRMGWESNRLGYSSRQPIRILLVGLALLVTFVGGAVCGHDSSVESDRIVLASALNGGLGSDRVQQLWFAVFHGISSFRLQFPRRHSVIQRATRMSIALIVQRQMFGYEFHLAS